MNFSTIGILILVVSLVSVFSAIVLACQCSNIPCSCGEQCQDTCADGYWYQGGKCSNDCSFSDSKHCQYDQKLCAKSCGAECDQNSDCSCPDEGCVGKDYHDYTSKGCSDSCKCTCEEKISVNDQRCPQCDANNVDCNDPACFSNPACTACDPVNCNNPACSNNVQCQPCVPGSVNCNLPSCFSDPICQACNTTVNCNNPACSNNTQCQPCVPGNVNCALPSCFSDPMCQACNTTASCNNPACQSSLICLTCDPNNVNCTLPSCANNTLCIAPTPTTPPSGGGGGIIGGGYVPPTVNPAVCGNNACEYSENCGSCPKDCLKPGQVCCSNISYAGNCCFNSDCKIGYKCSIDKNCQLVNNSTQPNQSCQEDWGCADWSACNNGVQLRKCVDKNNCGTSVNEPVLFRRCTQEPTSLLSGLFLAAGSLEGIVLISTLVILILLYIWRRKRSIKGTVSVPAIQA